ncbi:hypothetical protein AA0116_g4439 [Alternaria tenuissima]|nr:hypothetical protein AA0116_g4439 [Alternaria tenuissima]
MGNCGSSLDCAACGNIRNGGKCTKDLKFNADIAGIGVLVSFYFSALVVFLVVIWGYLTATLPTGLLQETDQHALKLLKKPFKRDKRHVGAETPIPIQMSRRQGRSDVLVSFIKMLSDQQLITGLSILIAALSSQCVISQLEHIWVRYCRITFTLIFLVFFTFAFLVDHLPAWQDQIVHCLLLDWRSQPGLLQISTLMINVVPVLIILWGKHLSAMARLIAPEAIHHRHVTTTMVDRMSMYFWSWTNNISISESANIVADARRLYGIAIRPSNTKTRISVWYFLEQYHEAYLSELPVWAFQFAYGTTNTIQAVWGVDAWGTDVEDETTTLGFGQVVAIGLLVLPLITLTELINEQSTSSRLHLPQSHELSQPIDDPKKSPPNNTTSELQVRTAESAQTDDSNPFGDPTDQVQSKVTRKVAIISLVFSALAAALMVVAGSINYQLVLIAILVAWAVSKMTITIKRQVNQARFVWKEIRSRKTQQTMMQSPPAARSTSDESIPHSTPKSISIDISTNHQDSIQTIDCDENVLKVRMSSHV